MVVDDGHGGSKISRCSQSIACCVHLLAMPARRERSRSRTALRNLPGGRMPTMAERLATPRCPNAPRNMFEQCQEGCAMCLMRSHAPVQFFTESQCGVCRLEVEPQHVVLVEYQTMMWGDPPIVLRQVYHRSCWELPLHLQEILMAEAAERQSR